MSILEKMVSAVITTYKRPPEIIKRAAESILNQTYKNIELIIVDDSPADYELRNKVQCMSDALGERVKYIKHEKNMGACAARNTGLKAAQGEYIAFLDDDDEWLPEKIEKQLGKFSNQEIALVYCGYFVVDTCKGIKEVFKTTYRRGNVFEDLIYANFIGSTSFPLIRKSVIEKLGGFDEKMKAAQDYEMWLRIAKESKVDYVDETLVNYYVHEGEQITKNHKGRAEAFLRLLDIHSGYLLKNNKAKANLMFCAAFELMHFDIKRGRRLFWKAFILYPFYIRKDLVAIKWLYVMPIIRKTKWS